MMIPPESVMDSITNATTTDTNLTNTTGEPSDEVDAFCGYDFGENTFARFLLIGIGLTVVCCVGITGNISIIFTLSRKEMRSTSSWFLMFLAVADSLVMTTTIMLYCCEVIYDYTRNVDMYFAWFSYVQYGYVISHVSQVFTIYLTLAASIERCMSLWNEKLEKTCCGDFRVFGWIFIIFLCTLSLTLCKFWELDVTTEPCEGFGKYHMNPAPLLQNETYELVYTVWMSNILFIFMPFILLSLLSALIWRKISLNARRDRARIRKSSMSIRLHKREMRTNRDSTRVMFAVVLVFLVCNTPQFVLTMIERIDPEFLKKHQEFYTFSRDAVNVLTVLNSSSNFLIYLILGREFRTVILGSLKRHSIETRLLDAVAGFGLPVGLEKSCGSLSVEYSSKSPKSSLVSLAAKSHKSSFASTKRNSQSTTRHSLAMHECECKPLTQMQDNVDCFAHISPNGCSMTHLYYLNGQSVTV